MLNLFGGSKSKKDLSAKNLVSEALSELLEQSGLSLSFQIDQKENTLNVDIFGEDEGLLKTKRGKLLLALQVYLSQFLYKNFPEGHLKIHLDSNGFWKEREERLLSLTDHLVKKALEKNRPIFFKQSLSPYQRRLVHERVSGNTGVRSQSYGSGLYKNLKLIPDGFTEPEER